jgi:hypothetical protein
VIETEDGARIDLEAAGTRDGRRCRIASGRWRRRCGSRARTSATAGSPSSSASGKASSTPTRIVRATRPTCNRRRCEAGADRAGEHGRRALGSAAIPAWRRGRERLARFGEGERALYRWVLGSFATGRVPAADEFTDAAGGFGVSVDQAPGCPRRRGPCPCRWRLRRRARRLPVLGDAARPPRADRWWAVGGGDVRDRRARHCGNARAVDRGLFPAIR